MKMMTTPKQNSWNSYVIRVKTPDGTMFVNIVEDVEEKPTMLFIHVGKSGGALQAWADAMGRMITASIQAGASFSTLARDLSGISSDKPLYTLNKATIHSGPDGLAYAMISYLSDKTAEFIKKYGDDIPNDYDWLDDRGTFPS